MSFLTKILTILRNNRIENLREIFNQAKNNHYNFINLSDYIKGNFKEPYLIVRHDVDYKIKGCFEMLDLENIFHIKADWFLRKSTLDNKLIEYLKKFDQNIGFHYETFSDYAKERGWCNTKDFTETDIEKIREIFVEDITEFRIMTQSKSELIAAHGTSINHKLKFANNDILDNKLREKTKILADAYDDIFFNNSIEYISDASIVNNNGWRYLTNPIDLIEQKKNIYLLLHPHQWHYSGFDKIKLFIWAFIYSFKRKKRILRRNYANGR